MIGVGIICPSEIAFRRFMPSLLKASERIRFTGIGYASPEEWFGSLASVPEDVVKNQQKQESEKARQFVDMYGGKCFDSYEQLIQSPETDAVYIPLPPALHYRWALLALNSGKHVLVEKPATCFQAETEKLIEVAAERNLALHENYMFVFHSQIKEIQSIIERGEQIGEPRLYRITFGFPRRAQNDFRYNKALGGGALLDAGGYTLRYASELLGPTAEVKCAQVNYATGFEVEIGGSATVVNDRGVTAQLAFGMDNDYRCEIEVWGSKGTLSSGRILTAPAGYVPSYTLKQNQTYTTYPLSEDDAFYKSILRFVECVDNDETRLANYQILRRQACLVQQFRDKSGLNR